MLVHVFGRKSPPNLSHFCKHAKVVFHSESGNCSVFLSIHSLKKKRSLMVLDVEITSGLYAASLIKYHMMMQ